MKSYFFRFANPLVPFQFAWNTFLCDSPQIFSGSGTTNGVAIIDDDDVPDPAKIKWKLPRKRAVFGAKYKCKICKEKFVRESTLSNHMAKHGKCFGLYTCHTQAGSTLGCFFSLRMLGPNGERIHRCKSCTKLFGSKEEARNHNVEVHGHKLNCDFCPKILKTPESRRYHMQSKHGCDGPVHICSKCGK